MIDGRRIKPISYLKSHAAEVLRDLAETGKPLVITQNGEGKAILIDINEYEKQRDAITLMKILRLSEKDVRAGRTRPAEEVFADLRKKHFGDDE